MKYQGQGEKKEILGQRKGCLFTVIIAPMSWLKELQFK